MLVLITLNETHSNEVDAKCGFLPGLNALTVCFNGVEYYWQSTLSDRLEKQNVAIGSAVVYRKSDVADSKASMR
jgi:hypothetical protein